MMEYLVLGWFCVAGGICAAAMVGMALTGAVELCRALRCRR